MTVFKNVMDNDVLDKVKKLTYFFASKFSVKEPTEDIFHDIILKMYDSAYLSRYDVQRSLHNYLSGFVYNHFCKVYKREAYPVSRAISMSKDSTDADVKDVCRSLKADSVDHEQQQDVSKLYEDLKTTSTFSSFVVYTSNSEYVGAFDINKYERYISNPDNVIFTRSTATVFYLLYMGFSQTEIKEILDVSKSWVSQTIHKISLISDVVEFARAMDVDYSKYNSKQHKP